MASGLDLWAPWYEPCRMVSPPLEQLARDLAGQVKLVKRASARSPARSASASYAIPAGST